jgi:hypothetical protein
MASSTREREVDSVQGISVKARRKGATRKTQTTAGGNKRSIKTDLTEVEGGDMIWLRAGTGGAAAYEDSNKLRVT